LNQNNSNIDKQLQDKFSNFTPVPPTFVWEQIDSKLEAKSKRKRGIIVWSVAASLTVAAISGLMLLMNHNSSNTIQVPVAAVHENASVQKTTQPEVIVPQEEEKNQQRFSTDSIWWQCNRACEFIECKGIEIVR